MRDDVAVRRYGNRRTPAGSWRRYDLAQVRMDHIQAEHIASMRVGGTTNATIDVAREVAHALHPARSPSVLPLGNDPLLSQKGVLGDQLQAPHEWTRYKPSTSSSPWRFGAISLEPLCFFVVALCLRGSHQDKERFVTALVWPAMR